MCVCVCVLSRINEERGTRCLVKRSRDIKAMALRRLGEAEYVAVKRDDNRVNSFVWGKLLETGH